MDGNGKQWWKLFISEKKWGYVGGICVKSFRNFGKLLGEILLKNIIVVERFDN